MNKLKICSPGGAGGNWLSHLIYSLENNVSAEKTEIHYHRTKKSTNVLLSHNVDDKSQIFFNGRYLFNIYLNVVKKWRVSDLDIVNTLSTREMFELLASEASSKLFFLEERIDLSWDDIFDAPDNFAQTLYKLLDQSKILYTANHNVLDTAVREYKQTCVNPVEHFNNFNSVYWLGWCNGICKHLWQDWPLVDTVEQMQEFLEPRRVFFQEYTKQYMLEFNDKT
jgi:hypothetical protein